MGVLKYISMQIDALYDTQCDQLAHSEYGSTHLQFVSAVIEHDSFGHSNAGQK